MCFLLSLAGIAETRGPLGPKRAKSYEDDPDWIPSDWYTRADRPKLPRPLKKSIDMIRYDQAKRELDKKRRKRLKKVVDKDHPYSAPSSVPASPAQVGKDHNYV